jgi:folate-binding protein YgfZ
MARLKMIFARPILGAPPGSYAVLVTSLDTAPSEYETLISACGLLDRSERGKLALTGSDARSFLQGQVTNDVEALRPGEGCYAAFLTPKGKMLGDVRILDTGEEVLLDTERIALQELFNMIRRFSIGYDVQLHKRTLESGLLSLIGPESDAVAAAGTLGGDEHAHATLSLGDVPARAIRTDLGIDLLCPAQQTGELWSELEARGAVEVPEVAAECLRVEHGRPRYGLDLDDSVIPQEAGLNSRAVSFTKGCYVGQETVARLHYRGKPNRHLRGLRLESPAQTGDQIVLEGRVVGRLGSVAQSPVLGPIALAVLRREAPPGSTVAVGEGQIPGLVGELPFR